MITQGGSRQTDMEALERQADKIRAAKAQSAIGAASSGGGGAAAEANPEEIDLDMDDDDDAGVSRGASTRLGCRPEPWLATV